MPRIQTKHHGDVESFKIKSMHETLLVRDRMIEDMRAAGYELVGSAPHLTMFVCEQHLREPLPPSADFCYIIATS